MALFNFLPNGFFDILNIDWNKINIQNTSFNSIPAESLNGEYDWGWGDSPIIAQTSETPEVIKAQIQTEVKKGNFSGAKVLGAVLTYGPVLLQILKEAGKWKNGTVSQIDGQVILDQTGGDLRPNTVNKTFGSNTSSTNTILGVPVSYVALGIGGLVLYKLFSDDKKKKK